EEGTPLRAWLYSVARNLVRDHARWAVLDESSLGTVGAWWYFAAPAGPGAPDEAAIAADARRRLERAFVRLPAPALETPALLAHLAGALARRLASGSDRDDAPRRPLRLPRRRRPDQVHRPPRRPVEDVGNDLPRGLDARVVAARAHPAEPRLRPLATRSRHS